MTDEQWLVLAKGQFKVGDNPTEEQINAKAQELKDAETKLTNDKTSGKAKLKAGQALTDDEIAALFGN